MKGKTFVSLVTIACLLLLSLACERRAVSYDITGGEATVVYSASQGATFLYVRCWILSRNDAHARITGWKIVYRSGKEKLLEVNVGNYAAYAPYVVFWDIYAQSTGTFILQCNEPGNLSNVHPYPGRLFPSDLPDNLDVTLTLTDADGDNETVDRNIEVTYSVVDR